MADVEIVHSLETSNVLKKSVSEMEDVLKPTEKSTGGDLHLKEEASNAGDSNVKSSKKGAGRRQIPRSSPKDHEKALPVKGSVLPGGRKERQRTTSESSAVSTRSSGGKAGGKGGKSYRRDRTTSTSSVASTTISEAGEGSPLSLLRAEMLEKYERKGVNLLNSYIRNQLALAKFENTVAFLERCDALGVVPSKYRLTNERVKNTKHVIRTLDRFSFQIMVSDLKYNQKRRYQVSKLLQDKERLMREEFQKPTAKKLTEDDKENEEENKNEEEDKEEEGQETSAAAGADLVNRILEHVQQMYMRRSERIADRQAKIYASLVKEYELTDEDTAAADERLKRKAERREARRLERELEREQKKKKDQEEGKDEKDDNDDKEDDDEEGEDEAQDESDSDEEKKEDDE